MKTIKLWMGILIILSIYITISIIITNGSVETINKENILLNKELTINDSPKSIAASKENLPISYSISENCSNYMKQRIRKSFIKIFEETNSTLFFIETNTNPDIKITCKIDLPLGYYLDGGTYTAGLSTLGVINHSINNATINFYNLNSRAETWEMGACAKYPDTEIHEILHVFGFNHNNKEGSIMSPSSEGCDVKSIDKYIVDCLKYTYSDGEKGISCYDREDVMKEEDIKYEECNDGWYNAIDSKNFCCPEPNMFINKDGYCE